jgi:hypothetical protein
LPAGLTMSATTPSSWPSAIAPAVDPADVNR